MSNATSLEKFNRLVAEKRTDIPVEVCRDAIQRVSDWLSAGGEEDAPYIDQQIRYVENSLGLVIQW